MTAGTTKRRLAIGGIALCVAGAGLVVPVRSRAQSGSPSGQNPAAGTLRVELRATPGTEVRVSQLDQWGLYLRITNLTSHAIDPRIDASELTVNGVNAPGWAFAISNGPRDHRFESLPPGDTIEAGRAMQGSLFHGPGIYAIVLRVGGNVSLPLVVRVRP